MKYIGNWLIYILNLNDISPLSSDHFFHDLLEVGHSCPPPRFACAAEIFCKWGPPHHFSPFSPIWSIFHPFFPFPTNFTYYFFPHFPLNFPTFPNFSLPFFLLFRLSPVAEPIVFTPLIEILCVGCSNFVGFRFRKSWIHFWVFFLFLSLSASKSWLNFLKL